MSEITLPAPRLQLRWDRHDGTDDFGSQWCCHYELVLPLQEHDIRREVYKDGEQVGERSELVVALKGPTLRGGNGTTPCVSRETGDLYFDAPFRDGVHSLWDSEVLGGLPVYVIALDGTPIADDRKARVEAA